MILISKLLTLLIILTLCDLTFIYFISPIYNKQIELVQNEPVNIYWPSGLLCYLALFFGLYYFIIKDSKPVFDAVLLGLVIYSVYALTNKALLKNWAFSTVLIDITWGGILFGLVTYIYYWVEFGSGLGSGLPNPQTYNQLFDIAKIHPASI